MTRPSHGQAIVEALGVLESAFAGLRTTVTNLAISREAAVQLLELALHLRKHGERAPGGNETWADFDRKAEDYLRTGRLPSYPRVRVPENTGKHPGEPTETGMNPVIDKATGHLLPAKLASLVESDGFCPGGSVCTHGDAR